MATSYYDMTATSWSPSLTANTWGLCAINPHSFNTHIIETWKATWCDKRGYVPVHTPYRDTYIWPKANRDLIITYARVYQLICQGLSADIKHPRLHGLYSASPRHCWGNTNPGRTISLKHSSCQ